MKRKVIQVANSTYLISLPIKWAREYGITKGAELELEIKGKDILIRNGKTVQLIEREIKFSDYESMIARAIHALYKKGVDTIRIVVDDPKQILLVQQAISKETVGYELMDQGRNSCTIKSITPNIEEFDNLLKRIFMLQLTICKDSIDALEKKEYDRLKSIIALEETNNRLTTMCRRAINKGAGQQFSGPLYYIVEDFENLADEYKYMLSYIDESRAKNAKSAEIAKSVLGIYQQVNEYTEKFFKLFYSFDAKLVAELGNERKKLVKEINELMDEKPTKVELRTLQHLSIAVQKIFCMVGPYLVMKL